MPIVRAQKNRQNLQTENLRYMHVQIGFHPPNECTEEGGGDRNKNSWVSEFYNQGAVGEKVQLHALVYFKVEGIHKTVSS